MTTPEALTHARGLVVPGPIPTARSIERAELLRYAAPQPGLSDQVNEDRAEHLADYQAVNEELFWALDRGVPVSLTSIYARHIDADGTILAERLCSHKTIVRGGAGKLRQLMDNSDPTTGANFRYHGIGTDGTAEAFTQSALLAELTTEYTQDNTRATGSQVQGAATNIYHSDSVVGVKSAPAATIKEFGLFSAAARGSGTMFDRAVSGFGPFTLLANQNLQIAYDWTLTG